MKPDILRVLVFVRFWSSRSTSLPLIQLRQRRPPRETLLLVVVNITLAFSDLLEPQVQFKGIGRRTCAQLMQSNLGAAGASRRLGCMQSLPLIEWKGGETGPQQSVPCKLRRCYYMYSPLAGTTNTVPISSSKGGQPANQQ